MVGFLFTLSRAERLMVLSTAVMLHLVGTILLRGPFPNIPRLNAFWILVTRTPFRYSSDTASTAFRSLS